MDAPATLGLGPLCVAGFTMSLFMAFLAHGNPATYDRAVRAILVASVVSAPAGYICLRATLEPAAMTNGAYQ